MCRNVSMNIFFLHMIPSLCAVMHCDKHVVKMILETTQLLCSAHHMTESTYEPCYKLTHKNHPCSVWTRQSISNYKWLSSLGIELCKEYTYRYGKTHMCEKYIRSLSENVPPIPDICMTPIAQAMPDEYKDKDPVVAYRNYYFFEKSRILCWKGKVNSRDTPDWVTEMYADSSEV